MRKTYSQRGGKMIRYGACYLFFYPFLGERSEKREKVVPGKNGVRRERKHELGTVAD